MEVVDKTWYKELEDPDTFYMNVMALKIIDPLTQFFLGLHTIHTVDITELMKALFTNADGVPQFVNTMEAVQRKSRWEKLEIQDEYIHAVAINPVSIKPKRGSR